MKLKTIIGSALAALMILGASAVAVAQSKAPRINGGPGIVMAGSQDYSKLPKNARSFIEKHFKGLKVNKCEQYFAKNKYEVELSNGIDLDFDNKGKLIEIDAPDGSLLPAAVVKEVLHHGAYKRLEKDGLASRIESIEFDKRGRVVEVEAAIPGPDVYVFDINGNFIAIED